MIKVLMILLVAGNAAPMIAENQKESFATMELCKEALPRLEAEAESALKGAGKVRGEDYEFKLHCAEPKVRGDDGSI